MLGRRFGLVGVGAGREMAGGGRVVKASSLS